MHPKFIRVENVIYSVELLKKVTYIQTELTLFFEGKSIEVQDPIGYIWAALNCFLEDLNRDTMTWKTCFCVDTHKEESFNIFEEGNKKVSIHKVEE